jgi:hypothetical protein
MTTTTLATTLSSCFPEGKRISQRTASYTPAEDKVLCEAWLERSTDPICGTEQKASKAIGVTYPFPRDGASSMPSIASFKGSFKNIQKRQISGLSVVDMVKPIHSLLFFFAYA